MADSSIFGEVQPLPKGPHDLTPEQIEESHRARLMMAMTELMAEKGWAGVSIADLVGRAGVSRTAFYESFNDKEDCLVTAYDIFSRALATRSAEALDEEASWQGQIESLAMVYLKGLQSDLDASRAFLLEMDSGGKWARERRLKGLNIFAGLLAEKHRIAAEEDPELKVFPYRVYLGVSFGFRELIRTELEQNPEPDLIALGDDVVPLFLAVINGSRQ